MKLTRTLFTVAGIPIKVHFSLSLLLMWILIEYGINSDQAIFSAIQSFTLIIFSVLAHELGHALCAKYYAVRTRDITLYPFGGVAYLLDRPNDKQDLLITSAGPAVNFIICVLIYALFSDSLTFDQNLLENTQSGYSWPLELFTMNLVLACFNLIPAYPMDGGRLLRSFLHLIKLPKAHVISTRISQAICILLASAALVYSNPILFVVACFVFINASKEVMVMEISEDSNLNIRAKDGMIPYSSLLCLSTNHTLEHAARFALKTAQTHFPIVLADKVIGFIEREDLLQKAVSTIEHCYISEFMIRNFIVCSAEENIASILEMLDFNRANICLVKQDSESVGLIIREQLQSLLLMQQVFKQNNQQRELERDLGAI